MKVVNRSCMDERKWVEDESDLNIRICNVSRPKVLVLGYFIMCWLIFVGVQKGVSGLEGKGWFWRVYRVE
jgi:hypothetical protein